MIHSIGVQVERDWTASYYQLEYQRWRRRTVHAVLRRPVTKALARPESVTAEERDFLLGRPSPGILESILHCFFPVPSAEPPADADAGRRGTGVDGQQQTDEQVQKNPSHCRSIPEVIVAAYGQPAQMAKLSLATQECVTLGWWTLQYERAPRPWEDIGDDDNAGTAAAEFMSRHMRPEELAFEDAVRALWCRPENALAVV
ncbi:hypothetical protein F4802DRAFT_114854 [Xylaria palmicola]|nr:hypothetical protein F4802DRAFT_114854 [Xylaria palmicola]